MTDVAISNRRRDWAERILEAWQMSLTGIFKAGQLLLGAREGPDALAHGEFTAMIETDLPFKHSTAFRLMAVARDQRLTNLAHVQCLPPHWGTLYELTKLPDDVFEVKIADGSIHPEMQREDVAKENRPINELRSADAMRRLGLDPDQREARRLDVERAGALHHQRGLLDIAVVRQRTLQIVIWRRSGSSGGR